MIMNQDSSINSITKAQNIKQAITDTGVPPTSKENAKNKPDIENEGNTKVMPKIYRTAPTK